MESGRRRGRSLVVLGLIAMLLGPSTPALAVGDWDPNDVAGPLDLRWFAGRYAGEFDVELTINFWEPVPNRRFPRKWRVAHHGITVRRVRAGEFGRIYRRGDGSLWFLWDETTPTIPQEVRVVRLSPSKFRIRFGRIHPGAYALRAVTVWRQEGTVIRDWSARIDLGAPPTDL
jgi:hypothetical protein